jgi:2-polyprenyl-3-methyl-5-hydroxy-6-metoxy-1,4-benzoquinol methylase
MTSHAEFYEQVETYDRPVERHAVFLDGYRHHRAALGHALDVLDVGCGEHAVLRNLIEDDDRYYGIDVKPRIHEAVERYSSLDLDRDDLASAWPGQRFDVIFCGEVIEHVFSPDRLLRQVASVAHPDSVIILSTSNLAYWVNRVLLVAGISPLFVENSAEAILGRRTRRLGQGNPTQGHLRLFTHRAMLDLLQREGFRVLRVTSVPVWNLPLDRLFARLSPHLGPDTVYLLKPPLSR